MAMAGDEQAISVGAARGIILQVVNDAMTEFNQHRDAIASHRDAIVGMHTEVMTLRDGFAQSVADQRAETETKFNEVKKYLQEKEAEHDVLNQSVIDTKDAMDKWAIAFRLEITGAFENHKNVINETRDQIQEMATRSGPEGGGGAGGAARGHERRIFDDREYKVKDLPEKCSPAQFKKWVHEVEIFLETAGESWKGIKALLGQCRKQEQEIPLNTGPVFDLMIRDGRAAGGNNLTGLFPFEKKGPDLYQLLMPRLNVELAGELRQDAADNGWELWRKLNLQLDPPREDAGFH